MAPIPPPVSARRSQLASGYAQAAYDAALQSKEVKAAAAKWQKCMAPAGISDLPASPALMPSDSMRKQLGLDKSPTPSPQELRTAVRDAKCRESSGYVEAAYNAEWARQVTALQKNADTLESVRAELAKHKAEVLRVIAAHAPVAPTNG